MPRLLIDGLFLTKEVNGIPRYVRELLRCLDDTPRSFDVEVLVPGGGEVNVFPRYRTMSVSRVGRHTGQRWEQFELPCFMRSREGVGLYPCNTAPVLSPGITIIHDISPVVNPSFYSPVNARYHGALFALTIPRARLILTVSEFSKREIERVYPAARGKVEVVPCAWQHMERVGADPDILGKLGLVPGGYFFALSTLSPNKNLRWIAETARLNRGYTFVIAGGMDPRVFGEHGIPRADNVIYPGFVSDSEAKALMASCRGFLFPTFYEGFGIPPLEALSCGAPVAVSDTEVMHEVYGSSAHYLDPHVPCEDVEVLFSTPVDEPGDVLKRFGWDISALRFSDAVGRCLAC